METGQHTFEHIMNLRRNQETKTFSKQIKIKAQHAKTYGIQQNSTKRDFFPAN
jgi:hypothetical protein